MQHLEPRAQVAYKERTLMDTLWHIGRVRPEQIITPIYGPFWNYRHHARLTVRDVAKKGGVLVGFHEKSSSYVAEMTGCHILTKNVSNMIMPMRELVSKLSIRQRMPQIEVAVGGNGRTALVFRVLETPSEDDMAILNTFGAEHKADIWLQPKGPDSAYPVDPANIDALGLQLPEFGVRINFKPTDFTQVNHELNETMVGRAVRLLGVEPDHKVADWGTSRCRSPHAPRMLPASKVPTRSSPARDREQPTTALQKRPTSWPATFSHGVIRTGKLSGRRWEVSTAFSSIRPAKVLLHYPVSLPLQTSVRPASSTFPAIPRRSLEIAPSCIMRVVGESGRRAS